MSVAVVSIGDEVLMGSTINTNAAYISQKLTRAGYKVAEHRVLPDDKILMRIGIEDALQRFPIVILTGGLGPTCDDYTREVLAEIIQSPLVTNEEIWEDLKQRYGDRPICLDNQALVIEKAQVLRNPIGTASGFKITQGQHILFALPGVPLELQRMFELVLDHLKKEGPAGQSFTHIINLFNLPESAVDPLLRQLELQYPDVKIGIYASFGILNVKFETKAPSALESKLLLKPLIEQVETSFQDHLFESERGKIEDAIHQLFLLNQWTLSLAESCTGGSVASRLTRLPGCSQYFLGSMVVYSNELKEKVLKVSPKTLKKFGAVSSEVVLEMVEGLQALTQSTYCLAVSGIAGPDGGTAEKPVGTVWGAILKKGEFPVAWEFRGFGSREMIIERAVNRLLAQILIDARGHS